MAKRCYWFVMWFGLYVVVLSATCLSQSALDSLTRQMEWVPQRASSANPDLAMNGDSRSIEAGEELVLGDMKGPGIINHIWCTVSTADIFHGRSLVLKVYYDGNEHPSVHVPLGDFFGVGHGALADYHSAVTVVSSHGRARSCFWKMPFRERAKVVIANQSTERTSSFYYYVDWQKHQSLPQDTVYFHAQYRQENPTSADDFLLLDTKGRGHYVGTVLSNHMAEQGWFGEGDDRFFVDGEQSPSLSGTGTEDYFGDAWGFRRFASPYFGVPLWDGYMPGDRVTAYRWHLLDPVPFTTSLRVQMETRGSVFAYGLQHLGQFLPREDFVSGVAYWYQFPVVELQEPLPPANDRVAPYRMISVSALTARAEPAGGFLQSEEGINYMTQAEDAVVEIDMSVPESGTYQVNAIMQYGLIRGVYQPSLNDRKIGGPIDFSAQGAFDALWTRLDNHVLNAGRTYTLKFTGVGRSPHVRTGLPSFSGLAISHLVLLRLEDLPGYQSAMKAATRKE